MTLWDQVRTLVRRQATVPAVEPLAAEPVSAAPALEPVPGETMPAETWGPETLAVVPDPDEPDGTDSLAEDVAELEDLEEPDELLVTEVDPEAVEPELARRLAALDALELQSGGRDLPTPSGDGLAATLAGVRGRIWLVGDPAKPLAWALLDWTADPASGRLHGVVHPKHRGRGASALLLDAVTNAARGAELREIVAEVYSESAAEAWLTQHGFVPTDTPPYAVRRLDLPRTFERRRRVTEDSLIYALDYQLVRVAGETEEGRTEFAVHAVLQSSGADVGRASLTVDDDTPEYAMDGTTWVREDHRGHRLGLLMKSDLLTWLGAERPRVRAVRSHTALDDPYLIAISDRLGSRVAGVMVELRLLL